MDELNIVITAIGAIVLLLGLVSDYFRLMICTSIVAQGLSATPLTKLYDKYVKQKNQSQAKNP